jgi:L-asparaginase
MAFDGLHKCCRFNPDVTHCGQDVIVEKDVSLGGKVIPLVRPFKTIYCIETGGTFSSIPSESGYLPGYHLPQLLNDYLELDPDSILGLCFPAPGTPRHFGKLLDSTNIKLIDQIRLANLIEEVLQLDKHSGIIVTHGTDTMAFTASMLSLLIPNPTKPIVLTGAMRGFTEPNSDAPKNLKDAAVVANSQSIQPGVYVVFNGRIIPGSWVTKIGLDDLDSFRSIYGGQDIARVDGMLITLLAEMKNGHEPKDQVIIKDNKIPFTEVLIDTVVIHPGLMPKQLDSLLSTSIGHGVIIRGYGSGAIPEDLLPIVKHHASNKPILVDTQVPLRGSGGAKYEVEESVLRAGIMTAQGLSQAMALNAFRMVLAEHGCTVQAVKQAWMDVLSRWGSGPIMPPQQQAVG